MTAPVYLSINEFPGDGVTTQFEFNFAGGYISRDHVKAYVSDALGVITPVTITAGMWVNDYTLNLGVSAPVGGKVRIYRDTPRSEPLVNFEDGARITEANLDLLARQTVLAVAEAFDVGAYATVNDLLGAAGATLAAAQQAEANAADSETAAGLSAIAASAARIAAETARDLAQAAQAATEAARDDPAVQTIYTNIADINTVAANIAAVLAVAGVSADVTTVAAMGADVVTVAGIQAAVSTVAANIANINAAVADLPSLSAKANISGQVFTGHIEVPAGASGAQVPQAQETAMLATTQFGLRNRFINPAFNIWQNGLSFTSSAGITYCAAQWMVADTGAGLNVARSFADSDACVVKNGAAGHTTGWLAQPIESYGIRDLTGVNAVGQITVSIDIICTAAQTGSIAVWRAGSEDNFTSPVLISSSAWTHPGGGVRQRKTATFTLPDDAKNGIVIYFNHNAIATGQHIKFARAQCEAGPLATPSAARPPAFEIALCQRYYEVGQAAVWQGQQSSYRSNAYVNFNTWKRVAPLMTYQVAEQNGYGSYDVNYVGQQGFNFNVVATATTADGRAAINWQASARLM